MSAESEATTSLRSAGAAAGERFPAGRVSASGVEQLAEVALRQDAPEGPLPLAHAGLIYNEKVVIQTERGLEIGEVGFAPAAAPGEARAPEGWVLRRAEPEDLEKHWRLNESAPPARSTGSAPSALPRSGSPCDWSTWSAPSAAARSSSTSPPTGAWIFAAWCATSPSATAPGSR